MKVIKTKVTKHGHSVQLHKATNHGYIVTVITKQGNVVNDGCKNYKSLKRAENHSNQY